MGNQKNKLLHYFIPRYDELALFVMSFSFILVVVVNGWFFLESEDISFTWSYDDIRRALAIGVFLTGLLLSLYHAFTDRAKSAFEKDLMLFFAVLVNAFCGIWGGTYALEHSKGFFMIFPILNIVNGGILLTLYRADVINKDSIIDDNVTLSEVAISAAIVCVLFFVCNFIVGYHPIATYSICVAYAMNGTKPIHTLLSRL